MAKLHLTPLAGVGGVCHIKIITTMKFYFSEKPNFQPREQGKLATIEAWPDSEGPKISPIRVLIAGEIEALESGENVAFGFVGEKKTAMVFPPRQTDLDDKRVLVLGRQDRPGHRRTGSINTHLTSGSILKVSQGYGAWGSGEVFLVILEPGQIAATNTYNVYENQNGNLFTHSFATKAEFELHYGSPEIEMI